MTGESLDRPVRESEMRSGSSVVNSGDYRFIPETLAKDDDSLNAMARV